MVLHEKFNLKELTYLVRKKSLAIFVLQTNRDKIMEIFNGDELIYQRSENYSLKNGLLDFWYFFEKYIQIRWELSLKQWKENKNNEQFFENSKSNEKTGIAKSTIWLWVSEGKFPKPIKLSSRITIWEEEKVDNWMKA